MIKWYFTEFRYGRIKISNAECSGRPYTSVAYLWPLYAKEFKNSRYVVGPSILNTHLDIRKLSARLVPRLLTNGIVWQLRFQPQSWRVLALFHNCGRNTFTIIYWNQAVVEIVANRHLRMPKWVREPTESWQPFLGSTRFNSHQLPSKGKNDS